MCDWLLCLIKSNQIWIDLTKRNLDEDTNKIYLKSLDAMDIFRSTAKLGAL